jgi:hypothetical protein
MLGADEVELYIPKWCEDRGPFRCSFTKNKIKIIEGSTDKVLFNHNIGNIETNKLRPRDNIVAHVIRPSEQVAIIGLSGQEYEINNGKHRSIYGLLKKQNTLTTYELKLGWNPEKVWAEHDMDTHAGDYERLYFCNKTNCVEIAQFIIHDDLMTVDIISDDRKLSKRAKKDGSTVDVGRWLINIKTGEILASGKEPMVFGVAEKVVHGLNQIAWVMQRDKRFDILYLKSPDNVKASYDSYITYEGEIVLTNSKGELIQKGEARVELDTKHSWHVLDHHKMMYQPIIRWLC